MNEILNQFILGDCIEVMKSIEDCSISTCITDPPYNYEFVGKDWSNEIIFYLIEIGLNFGLKNFLEF